MVDSPRSIHVFIYNNEVLGFTAKQITIRDALGKHFSYAELWGAGMTRAEAEAMLPNNPMNLLGLLRAVRDRRPIPLNGSTIRRALMKRFIYSGLSGQGSGYGYADAFDLSDLGWAVLTAWEGPR